MPIGIFCRNDFLRILLEHRCQVQGFEVVSSTDTPEPLAVLEDTDLLLCHLSGQDAEALASFERVRHQGGFRILVVREAPSHWLTEALAPHVEAVIPDEEAGELLFSTLELVERGYRIMPPERKDPDGEAVPPLLVEVLPPRNGAAPRPPRRSLPPGEPRLSPQEALVLAWLTEGYSNKEIARHLHITEATVKVHLRSIFRKLSVSNRTQAALWVTRHPGALSDLLETLPEALRAGEGGDPPPGWQRRGTSG